MEFMKNVIEKDRILIHYKTLYRLEIELVNMLNLRLSGKDQRQNNLFLLIIKKKYWNTFSSPLPCTAKKSSDVMQQTKSENSSCHGSQTNVSQTMHWSWVKSKGYFAKCLLEIFSRNFWKEYEGEWNGLSCIFSICIQQEPGNVSLRAPLLMWLISWAFE